MSLPKRRKGLLQSIGTLDHFDEGVGTEKDLCAVKQEMLTPHPIM